MKKTTARIVKPGDRIRVEIPDDGRGVCLDVNSVYDYDPDNSCVVIEFVQSGIPVWLMDQGGLILDKNWSVRIY